MYVNIDQKKISFYKKKDFSASKKEMKELGLSGIPNLSEYSDPIGSMSQLAQLKNSKFIQTLAGGGSSSAISNTYNHNHDDPDNIKLGTDGTIIPDRQHFNCDPSRIISLGCINALNKENREAMMNDVNASPASKISAFQSLEKKWYLVNLIKGKSFDLIDKDARTAFRFKTLEDNLAEWVTAIKGS